MTDDNLSPTDEAIDAFLADYMAICHKHNLMVNSCGCCDGPWIVRPSKLSTLPEHFEHLGYEP